MTHRTVEYVAEYGAFGSIVHSNYTYSLDLITRLAAAQVSGTKECSDNDFCYG